MRSVRGHAHYLLTVEFGWTADKHRRWLTDLLEAELLGPRPTTTTRL
jgi:hypothetical protein